MKNKTTTKGFKAFETVYYIGIVFAMLKLLDYLQWTFQLIRKWSLPKTPFFSKVDLVNNNVEMSIEAYLIFAMSYIVMFSFIILGLCQLKKSINLFDDNKVFQKDISDVFLKAGKSFFVFVFGTFIVDVALLIYTMTGSRIIDLMSTELIVFIILGYLMFFLSDVFKKGIIIKQENDLTI